MPSDKPGVRMAWYTDLAPRSGLAPRGRTATLNAGRSARGKPTRCIPPRVSLIRLPAVDRVAVVTTGDSHARRHDQIEGGFV